MNIKKTKRMKIRIQLVQVMILLSSCCLAQSAVTLEASQVISNFDFQYQDGSKDKSYAAVTSGGYSLGYRHLFKGLFVRAAAGMRPAGATLSLDNLLVSYNFQYVDLRVGFGYELTRWRFRPYLSVAPYAGFLTRANQRINGVDYDLRKNKNINSSDAGILVIPGIRLVVSDYFSFYSEINYLRGFQNLETKGNEKLRNNAYILSLGISATITKVKPKWL